MDGPPGRGGARDISGLPGGGVLRAGLTAVCGAFERSGRAAGVAGYRHVYLEGMEEASIFVHVAISDVSGKVRAARRAAGLAPAQGPQPRCQGCRASWLPCWACFPTGTWVVGHRGHSPAPRLSRASPALLCLRIPGPLSVSEGVCLALLPVPRIPGWGTSPVSPFLSSGPRRGPACGGVSGVHGGWHGPGAHCLSPATSMAPRCRRPLGSRSPSSCLSVLRLPVSRAPRPAVCVSPPSLCLFGLAVAFPMPKVYL